ncbi:MAG: aromatic hydrocarbon degradation protein, partial [Algoriella sp.]
YWIPDYNSYKSYFNRVIYRAGAYYQSAQYSIYGTDITSYGATLGFGLPIGKQNDASMMNVSFEYGQKGKATSNLIKENYFGVKLGFDINDIWFRKRVID